MIPDIKSLALAVLIAGALGFGGGYKVADWRFTAQANGEALERARRAEKALATVIIERDALAGALAAKNDKNLTALKDAQNETNRLRDCLRAGTCGLRVAVACTNPAGPQSPARPGVDSGTGAELAEPARRAYFALRDGIDRSSAQLAACQDELRLRVR